MSKVLWVKPGRVVIWDDTLPETAWGTYKVECVDVDVGEKYPDFVATSVIQNARVLYDSATELAHLREKKRKKEV